MGATNIRCESQGPDRKTNSIQRHVIEHLLTDVSLDVVFDDDGSGEIADVVTFSILENQISVTLWHCKYSKKNDAGARIGDLYEVCGQAQKSARWRDRPNRMFTHMLHREKLRRNRGLSTRFERGGVPILKKLKARWQEYKFDFIVRIVQPGLSKEAIGEEGLHLLAATKSYLLDTRAMPLRVIGSV